MGTLPSLYVFAANTVILSSYMNSNFTNITLVCNTTDGGYASLNKIETLTNKTYSAPKLSSVTKSADYTVLDNDGYSVIYVDDTTADRTITLPTLADNLNRVLTIKNISTQKGKVTVDGEGAETIDGDTTFILDAKYSYVTIQALASGWQILDWFIHDKTYLLFVTGDHSYADTQSFARIFRTKNNDWRAVFLITGTCSGTSLNVSVYMDAGLTQPITFKDGFENRGQPVSFTGGSPTNTSATNNNNVIFVVSGTTIIEPKIGGEVMLASKPAGVA